MFVNFSMYKIILIFLFTFVFTETVEVYYKTDTPIAGFQFNIEGVKVTDAFSGDAETEGFTITTDNNIVLGFSFDGATIQTGNGILLVLDVDGNTDNICLIDVIISDNDGEGLDVTVEDCNTIIIYEDDIINGIGPNISGKITNSDGEPIIGTQVFIEELGIGAVADTAGNYILLNLPIGSYDITAEMILYRSQIISNVIVDAEKTTELNITLDVEEHLKPSDGSINKFYNTSWAVIIGINE